MSTIRLLYFLIWVGSAFSNIGFNLYAKLFGYKEIISISLFLWGTLLLITGVFPNIWNIAIMIFINGTLEGARTNAMGFLMIDMFPEQISLAIAISSLGSPLGIIIYAEFAMLMCNPDNTPADLSFKEGADTYKYFNEAIGKNLSVMFIVIGSIAMFLSICLELFTKNPQGIRNHILDYCPCFKNGKKKNPQIETNDEEVDIIPKKDTGEETTLLNVENPDVKISMMTDAVDDQTSLKKDKTIIVDDDYCRKSIISVKSVVIISDDEVVTDISDTTEIWKTAQFWILFIILSYQLSNAYFFISSQKTYAIKIYSDEIINYTSYTACIASVIGRLGAGIIIDKFGHDIVMISAGIVNILYIILFNYFLHVIWVYFIIVGLIFFGFGLIHV